MKAIVLSFDKQHPYCELCYRMYMDLWPDCPFTFRVPWNNIKPNSLSGLNNVELIQCDQSISQTMQSLLEGIDDDEFVYWCIDDRFPIYIDTQKMSDIYNEINIFKHYSYVRPFCPPDKWIRLSKRWQHQASEKEPTFKGFIQQSKLHEYGYYMHQFCKAGVLRSLFSHKNCNTIYDFHKLLTNGFYKNVSGLRLPLHVNFIKFKEPCIRGKTTSIGHKYLNKLKNKL